MRALGGLVLAPLAATAAGAQPALDDPGLAVELVTDELAAPASLTFIGDDDFLVIQKNDGRVMRVTNGSVTGAVLDLPVNSAGERGGLGIAAHPDFGAGLGRDWVYVYYTESGAAGDVSTDAGSFANRVVRYAWDGAALGGATPILTLPGDASTHNGGVLAFGPDRMLYGVIGDNQRDGQLQNNAAGAAPDDTGMIFRVDEDGTAPAGNPFFALGGEPPEGLRLRRPQFLRARLRSAERRPLGHGERPGLVRRGEPRGARLQQRLARRDGPGHARGPGRLRRLDLPRADLLDPGPRGDHRPRLRERGYGARGGLRRRPSGGRLQPGPALPLSGERGARRARARGRRGEQPGRARRLPLRERLRGRRHGPRRGPDGRLYVVEIFGNAVHRIGASGNGNGNGVGSDFAVTKLKQPRRVALSERRPLVTKKGSVQLRNEGTGEALIADAAALAALAELAIETAGGACPAPELEWLPPKKGFPVVVRPRKKLKLSFLVHWDCIGSFESTFRFSLPGDADPSDDVCPRPRVGEDRGCGRKPAGSPLGTDVVFK